MQQNGALPEHKVVEKFKIAALLVFVNREKAVSDSMEVGIRNLKSLHTARIGPQSPAKGSEWGGPCGTMHH